MKLTAGGVLTLVVLVGVVGAAWWFRGHDGALERNQAAIDTAAARVDTTHRATTAAVHVADSAHTVYHARRRTLTIDSTGTGHFADLPDVVVPMPAVQLIEEADRTMAADAKAFAAQTAELAAVQHELVLYQQRVDLLGLPWLKPVLGVAAVIITVLIVVLHFLH